MWLKQTQQIHRTDLDCKSSEECCESHVRAGACGWETLVLLTGHGLHTAVLLLPDLLCFYISEQLLTDQIDAFGSEDTGSEM